MTDRLETASSSREFRTDEVAPTAPSLKAQPAPVTGFTRRIIAATIRPSTGAQATPSGGPTSPSKPLESLLADANELLAYAVEAGIEVENDIVKPILAADKPGETNWQASPDPEKLLTAITVLAKKLHPVTAETIRACQNKAHSVIRRYEICVSLLAIILLPASILGAVYTGIASKINSHINEANELVLQLNSASLPPADRVSTLQQLTIRIRAIQSRATQINFFNIDPPPDRVACDVPTTDNQASRKTELVERDLSGRIEIPLNIDVNNEVQTKATICEYTKAYQDVRYYAKNVLDETSIWFGATSASILPILYALLGAYASVLRAFKQQLDTRTFDQSYASAVRFIVAAIGGGVIGLFNFAIGEGVTVSPLALAFLVGYSAEPFFASLEKAVPTLPKLPTPRPKLAAPGNRTA